MPLKIFAITLVFFGGWIVWTWFLYPKGVIYLANRRGLRQRPKNVSTRRISFLVPCRNEEDFVVAKAADLRRLGGVVDKWEALFVDDCSTDSTATLLGGIEGAGISVLRTSHRAGKIGALRLAAESSSYEILVVTDCGCNVAPEDLSKLLAWFENPQVGLVTGTYLAQSSCVDMRVEGESAYWASERMLRQAETTLGSTTHATGALFAVRADLFSRTQWPVGTTNDDIHLPVQILAMGYDVVCEPEAVAKEYVDTNRLGEFRRRARIALGNFQILSSIPSLIRARRWFPIVQLFSHKLYRINQSSSPLPLPTIHRHIWIMRNN
jgi:cellulose synthase/poly-beta-1,6-N-acetylglucosamine synthase-like glycosyltransferase